ncbi:hypothetical protein FQZ97_1196100 [compost metagenome]
MYGIIATWKPESVTLNEVRLTPLIQIDPFSIMSAAKAAGNSKVKIWLPSPSSLAVHRPVAST